MMKYILPAISLLAVMILVQSCYYDDPPELQPIDCDLVSYSTHVVPIFESACATSGCHDGTREPDLRAGMAHNAIVSGGYVNITAPEESNLYKTVEFIENPMPPGGPKISELDRNLILCWISEGALND